MRIVAEKSPAVYGKVVFEASLLWLLSILRLPNDNVVFTLAMVAEKSNVVLTRPFPKLYWCQLQGLNFSKDVLK